MQQSGTSPIRTHFLSPQAPERNISLTPRCLTCLQSTDYCYAITDVMVSADVSVEAGGMKKHRCTNMSMFVVI